VKDFPVCPTYASLQSGRISLYTADSENLSGVGGFWHEKVSQEVIGSEGYFVFCSSEYVVDVGGLLTYVGEFNPSVSGCL
jgi:hypothetical protein